MTRKVIIGAVTLLLIAAAAFYGVQATGRLTGLMALIPGAKTSDTASLEKQPGKVETKERGQQRGGATGAGRGPAAVETALAASVTLSDDLQAVGTLLSEDAVDIAPETAGRIAEVLFTDGAAVDKGQVLFKLDDALIQAQIADAKARLILAEQNFNRNTTLRRSKNVTQSALDSAISELELAKTALGLAEVQLDKLSIRAPFAGTAGFRGQSAGAYVTPGAKLVHLEKSGRLFAEFSVAELDSSKIALGGIVQVIADALPGQIFNATISAIDPALNVEGRALKARAAFDNLEGKLRPGLLVRVTLKGAPRQVVTVPESALVARGNGAVVYIAESGKAREVKVRGGKRLNGQVEILENLRSGAEVIVAGNTRLSDGAAIEAVNAQKTQ